MEDRRHTQVDSQPVEPYADRGSETAVELAAGQAEARHLAERYVFVATLTYPRPSMSRARYVHCPRCGATLVTLDERGVLRTTCPRCGFIHYRNPVPAAGVILAGPAGVLLVKRRFEPRAGAWCLPAGFMEYGETPERTARRETREETGFSVRLTGLFGVYAGFDDPRVRAVLIPYTAERAGGRLVPGDDAIETRSFPLARLPKDIAFHAHHRALEQFRASLED